MKNLKFLFWIFLAVAVSLTACSKDDDDYDDDNGDQDNGNGSGEVSTDADTVAVANRVVWFRFTESDEDEEGHTTTGSNVQYTTDRYGNSASAYKGSANSSIVITDPDDLRLSSMTVSMWLRAQQLDGGTNFIISFIDPEMDWNAGYAIWQEGSQRGDTLRYKAVTRHHESDFFAWTDTDWGDLRDVLFPSSRWFHFAYVYNGENSVRDMYLNGLQVANDTLTAEGTYMGPITVPESAGFFYVGKNPNTAQEWIGNYQGDLDDLRIFDIPLSPEQIEFIYDAEKPE
ncbi:MAG: LamG domain-containing protein [Bacteroidales bacterium]